MSAATFKNYTISLIILSSCVVLLQATAQENEDKLKCFFTNKYTVQVLNRLPLWSNIPMSVHCAAGDDDKGFHKLPINSNYSFRFCENIFGRSLYFCHFWWNSRLGRKQKVFDAFTDKLAPSCTDRVCSWLARQDGIYFSGGSDPLVGKKIFDWQNDTSV